MRVIAVNPVDFGGLNNDVGINFAGNRNASISGILANEGSRKLVAVEIRISLYDVYGDLSKQRVVYALRPGLGFNLGPMKPLERRTFTANIESVDQLWNPKRVEIELTGLKYE